MAKCDGGTSPGSGIAPVGFAALFLVAAIAGCLPSNPPPPPEVRPAPIVQPAINAQDAHWRAQYDRNRPPAPREYQVMPRPSRDNAFGEFLDDIYMGMDPQPDLPSLPADAASPNGGAFPPPGGGSFPGGGIARPGMGTAAPFPAAPAAPSPAGIRADGHFYPVEQLIYGGDQPDIDRPELYRLMPKDAITLTVRDHPEFSGQAEIQPDGTIRIPNTPDLVRLRGLTVDEAAEAVRRAIAPYIKGECVVRVQVNRARGGYYFVFGEVLQPGRYPMGMEPIKLSDAILAANWEGSPAWSDIEGDPLSPSFPAAPPRGKFIAPRTADLARVELIVPHRSQPVRTVHDVRSALLGVTADDPQIRPGQIIVVPSLVPGRNQTPRPSVAPEALAPGQGFSGASSPARLPDAAPPLSGPPPARVSAGPNVEANMSATFDANLNGETYLPAAPIRETRSRADGSSAGKAGARDGSGWRKGL